MSFNVAIVIPPVPADDVQAWAELDHLINQQGPRPAVFDELHNRLTARYPCICSLPDDEVDDGVWSDGPLIGNFGHRAAVLGMVYSRAHEVFPFLIESSNALGLVVFDWTSQKIFRAESCTIAKAKTPTLSLSRFWTIIAKWRRPRR